MDFDHDTFVEAAIRSPGEPVIDWFVREEARAGPHAGSGLCFPAQDAATTADAAVRDNHGVDFP